MRRRLWSRWSMSVTKDGKLKIIERSDLLLTGAAVVSMTITDLCVFQVKRGRGWLEEVQRKMGPGFALQMRLQLWSESRDERNICMLFKGLRLRILRRVSYGLAPGRKGRMSLRNLWQEKDTHTMKI